MGRVRMQAAQTAPTNNTNKGAPCPKSRTTSPSSIWPS